MSQLPVLPDAQILTDTQHQKDKRQIAAAFSQAASRYQQLAVAQQHIGQELLNRLDLVRLSPQWVLDLGAGPGFFSRALSRKYSKAQILSADLAEGMVREAKRHKRWLDRQHFLCADAEALPLASDSIDLVFSNFSLQWCDLNLVLAELWRVMKPGGLLVMTLPGPDSLHELRHSFAQLDARPHVNQFIEMHQLGDLLVQQGFAEPVLDRDELSLVYPSLKALLAELKALGVNQVMGRESTGLMTPARWRQLSAAYEQFRRPDGLPMTYEVNYVHAWIPANKQRRSASGEVSLSLDALRQQLGLS